MKIKNKRSADNSVVIDGEKWTLSVTRNMSFWHQYMSSAGHYFNSLDFGVYASQRQPFVTFQGTQTHVFVNAENMKEYGKAVLAAVSSEAKLKVLKNKYRLFAVKLLNSVEKCVKHTSIENWNDLTRDYTRFCAGLYLTTAIGRLGAERLTEKLKKLGYAVEKISSLIAITTYPAEHTPLFNSQLDLLKIGKKIQNKKIKAGAVDRELRGWLAQYGYIPVNFCDEPWSREDAQAQLRDILEKDCAKELAVFEQEHLEKVRAAKALLGKINNSEVTGLARALQEGTYLNEFRKNKFSQASIEVRKIFRKIATKAGLISWRDCFYLLPSEIGEIIAGKNLEAIKLIKARKVAAVGISPDGKLKLLPQAETLGLEKYLRSIQGSQETKVGVLESLKGVGASSGQARGTVKVILSSKDFYKLRAGDILVATMTSVDFVPVMKKAAAFVTNEGGVTSHASIVAREMNKPCVIGTKIATQVLRDGDLVEVDADQGIVKVIK